MRNMLFDFWGTIGYLKSGKDFGMAIAQLLGITKKTYLNYVKQYWFKQNLLPEEFARIMLRRTETDESKLQDIVRWLKEPVHRARLYPEAKNVLRKLRHAKTLYLVSDTSNVGKFILNSLGIMPYFVRIFLSNEFGKTKKEGLYKTVFKEIGQNPKDCLIVGDSLESDYQIPRSLGAKALLIDRDGKYPTCSTIKNLEELI